jgi:hypothetical protein
MDWHKMTTLNEMIEIIKAENPNGLRIGDDNLGYTDLSAAETKAQIAEWAANRLAKETRIAEAEAARQALLAKLGITADEAKLLFS